MPIASKRVYNFSAGPAMLPTEVLEKVQTGLLDWEGTGTSVMEISHRSEGFLAVARHAEHTLRSVLAVPDHYKILFMQGGGRGQFSMVPMNLLARSSHRTANYINTGIWSDVAIKEAERYGSIHTVCSSASSGYTCIPDVDTWTIQSDAAYLHYVDNETINGVEFNSIPELPKEMPLISDMSSNILSRPIPIERFGIIYACAQKNIGPSGLTIAIVREDLLDDALPITPTLYRYKTYAETDSLYNTPPTFAWYLAGQVFEWIQKKGGVSAFAEYNARKAKKLYQAIDSSDLYENKVDPACRSRMNVPFTLTRPHLTARFLEQAGQAGLVHLTGHARVGGVRASLYNAMPEAGVDSLIEFMDDFALKNR